MYVILNQPNWCRRYIYTGLVVWFLHEQLELEQLQQKTMINFN